MLCLRGEAMQKITPAASSPFAECTVGPQKDDYDLSGPGLVTHLNPASISPAHIFTKIPHIRLCLHPHQNPHLPQRLNSLRGPLNNLTCSIALGLCSSSSLLCDTDDPTIASGPLSMISGGAHHAHHHCRHRTHNYPYNFGSKHLASSNAPATEGKS